MIKVENTRCSWSKEETNNLLASMKKHNVMELLDGKTRRNKNVYVLLANELGKKGFNKSSEQVKLRFRTLKQQFLKTNRSDNKSYPGKKPMEHFDDMKELLSDRPMVKALGEDNFIVKNMIKVEDELEEDCEYMEVRNIVEDSIKREVDTEKDDDEIVEECEYMDDETINMIGKSESTESLSFLTQQKMEKTLKKNKSALEMTLLEIVADIRESHQSTLRMIKEENNAFMVEQRRLQDKYLQETRSIMEEDRKETKQMLLELLKKR